MSVVLKYLERLNRKERFHLLTNALGECTFTLDHKFREDLQECLGGRLPETGIPPNAFVAMDYHMDWIQMALRLAEKLPGFLDEGDREYICHSKDDKCGEYPFRGNQQDVDLLVAFHESGRTHIIMIEAKAETGWTNEQLNGENGKIERLKAVFGENGKESNLVVPHLVLTSPKYSKRLEILGLPCWAKNESSVRSYYWVKLELPELTQVKRIDPVDLSKSDYKQLSITRKRECP